MQIMQTKEAIARNLRDAGCDRRSIEAFLKELQTGQEEAGFKRLAAHRKTLLERLHQEQKRIDCLDYLVYQLKKNPKTQRNAPTAQVRLAQL